METGNALVFDRHPLIRNTLRTLLTARGFSVFDTGSEVELLKMASEQKPEIITLDIPSRVTAIDTLIKNLIRIISASSKILIITSQPTEYYSACCVQAGASGLVSKKARMSCLNAAIDAVIHDYIFFPSKDLLLVSSDSVAFNKNQRESIDCLTGREKDVLYKVLQDKSLTQVAEELGVSIKTISTYKSRIFKKLDVTNLVELSLLLNRILRRNSERAEHGLSVSSD
ncbi:response regulator transcription factor [Yersinia frederiksenii]|uniref:response regulator transcription factor n=1 Tax=Yersinia frederiksenii TaxID=29484 RepID=UPI0005DC64F7|nr:response regulator transcription factor [Yersinia frederiksenii]CNG74068.1 putative two-component response regulator [Yersinia frederiksenii]